MVSVIITTYKRPLNILKRAIDSVCAQTYREIEILVINDNPDENAISEIKRLINKYKQSMDIKYIDYGINKGANYARNVGIANAKGKYIAFLDDDDEWLPTKIEKQVRKMEDISEVGIVYCNFYIMTDNKKKERKIKKIDNEYKLQAILKENFIGSTSFPLIRKSAIEEVGNFDTKMESCQEYELYIRILKKWNLACIEEELGIYYLGTGSTFKNNYKKYYNGDRRIIDKHKELYIKNKTEYIYHLNNMAFIFFRARQLRYFGIYRKQAIIVGGFSFRNSIIYMLLKKIKRKMNNYE